jgi:hypothetical protein
MPTTQYMTVDSQRWKFPVSDEWDTRFRGGFPKFPLCPPEPRLQMPYLKPEKKEEHKESRKKSCAKDFLVYGSIGILITYLLTKKMNN